MNQARWQRITNVPLALAAVIFLIAYAIEVLANLQGDDAFVTESIINVTWALFLIDYVVNLILAKPRWRWFYSHLLDLAIVALPVLRPLRLLRLVTLLAVLQRTAGAAFRNRVVLYVAGAAMLLVFVAALAMLDAERGVPGSNIDSFPEALWWAVVTITTVGYGDLYPVTDTGRFIATGVMIGGIALLGVVTATLASWIVEKVTFEEVKERAATHEQVTELARELKLLRQRLEERQ